MNFDSWDRLVLAETSLCCRDGKRRLRDLAVCLLASLVHSGSHGWGRGLCETSMQKCTKHLAEYSKPLRIMTDRQCQLWNDNGWNVDCHRVSTAKTIQNQCKSPKHSLVCAPCFVTPALFIPPCQPNEGKTAADGKHLGLFTSERAKRESSVTKNTCGGRVRDLTRLCESHTFNAFGNR